MKIIKLNFFNFKLLMVSIVAAASLGFRFDSQKEPFTDYFDTANMDRSVRPGDDFYAYANGTWLKKHDIPPTEVVWGDATITKNESFKKLRGLLENGGSQQYFDSMQQKACDMFRSGMDTLTINKMGITPAKPDLDRIGRIKTPDGLQQEIALEQSMGFRCVFLFNAVPDLHNSAKLIANFAQGLLGMPEKSYYFDNDAGSKKVRDAYLKYITKILVITGHGKKEVGISANDVLKLETALAKASKTENELREVDANYNRYSAGALKTAIPGINWPVLFNGLGFKPDSVEVGQPDFFRAMAIQLRVTGLETWKNYLRFRFIDNTAAYLDHNTSFAHYEFNEKTLKGRLAPRERAEEVTIYADTLVGDPLGYLYVKKYFSPVAKARVDQIVKNLREAFEERIARLDWMSELTRKKAIAKLHAIIAKIGYPDNWRSYASVNIDPKFYYRNAMACKKYLYQDMITQLKAGKTNRRIWDMTPPTYDAEYTPWLNTIDFPAGILQYPSFAADADDAINYGGIGWVIGHELTHAFDDQGRQYDGLGNRVDWWTPEDAKRFAAKAQGVIKLFDGFSVLDSLHVNGDLTQGENIADFGGLAIAFDAFKKTAQYKTGKKINGFTPAQRFFLSHAQFARRKESAAYVQDMLRTNPHSPYKFRVNGPYFNFDEFYTAFNIKPRDKMYRPKAARVGVW
ncbi:M13 family metallopeptidase [Mucilaginibacter sp.]|uniref:M13 family metallopeptidase n=1 Tax=Mucilaginibacter sp. TaxID=1882438 RepID=UPI0025FE4E01|nr:M13 family metallopeptidase [Mucilaginibacter sp.]